MSRLFEESAITRDLTKCRSKVAISVQPALLAGRIPLLDGFRAIAVLLVVVAHLCQMKDFPCRDYLHAVLVEGQIGVDVFFVLSGFLITTLLVREHQRTGTTAIGSFYFRRCVRILPAYFTFLAVVFALEKIGRPQLTGKDWFGALTYTTNFLTEPSWRLGHLWSLSIEEHFYLIWPFVFTFVSPQRRWMLPFACISLSILVRVVCYFEIPDHAWMCNRWTFTRCNGISVGCLLSLAATRDQVCRSVNRLGWSIHPIFYSAALVASIALSSMSYFYATIAASVINGLLIAGFMWSCLLREQFPSVKWLDNSYLRMIGVRSYSIYLWQQLILSPGSEFVGDSLLLTIATIVLLAEASWRLVEMPTLRWNQSVSPAVHAVSDNQFFPLKSARQWSLGAPSDNDLIQQKDLANV